MAELDAGISREKAFALLAEHNKEEFHIEHAETVEGVMRYFAEEIDPNNVEFWGIVGLLHDLDWEEYPTLEDHTVKAATLIEQASGSKELIAAIQSHSPWGAGNSRRPELEMEKVLYATDELTGLIGAAIKMRPSGSVMDFTTKSLKKKFKDKSFAAGCSRDIIAEGADMLGWELNDLFTRTIEAMQSFAPDKDTFQSVES